MSKINEQGRITNNNISEIGYRSFSVTDETGLNTANTTNSITMLSTGGGLLGGTNPVAFGATILATGGGVLGGTNPLVFSVTLSSTGGAVAGGDSVFSGYNRLNNIPDDALVCTIKSTPPQSYTLQDRILSVGTIRKPMGGIIGNLENANTSVTLDNNDGYLSTLFAPPPVGLTVIIAPSGLRSEPYFSGIITSISLGQTVVLNLEAGERIPLSSKIPLLSSTQLPGYRVDTTIPIAYGSVMLSPIAADSVGTLFIVAGHPCQAVEAVFIDNAEVQGWVWKNSSFDVGTLCTITLSVPLLSNQKLTCRVRGKLNPRTGELLQNPADIVWDVLANVSGISLLYSEMDRFRTEMTTHGAKLSGSIGDGRNTIRSVIDEIMCSCGSIWSGQVPGIASRYLGVVPQPARAVIIANDIKNVSISSELQNIATALKLSYAYDASQNQHTKAAWFDCKNSIMHYGRTTVDLNASWMTDSRSAALMGEQYLQWKSTPYWLITVETGGAHKNIVPGQWVKVIHPYFRDGHITEMCINAELNITSGAITLQFRSAAAEYQAITLTGLSSAFDPQTMKGTQIQFANGQAKLTFTNDKGDPLAGAKVTIDGSQVKNTDKAGMVVFNTSRGSHHVKVEATGYQAMEGEIEI